MLLVYVLFTINDKFRSNDNSNYVKLKLRKVFYSNPFVFNIKKEWYDQSSGKLTIHPWIIYLYKSCLGNPHDYMLLL